MSNVVTAEEEVRARAIVRVRDIVLQAIGNRRARVWLFGSQAAGRAQRSSDIDVAVEPLEPVPAGFFAELRERLDESLVPYHVDVVDLRGAEHALVQRVRQDGIVWKS